MTRPLRNNDWRAQQRTGEETLIPPHGGYRNLKTFQLAEVIYDVTVRFCDKYVDPRSRTHDQMVQAARSGRQNIAEGSADSGTSKKLELKLTGVARGSLEELRLDYEDFLRQRSLPRWEPNHPALLRFKARRCANLQEFRAWIAEELSNAKKATDEHGQTQGGKSVRPCRSVLHSARPCPSMSDSVLTSVLAANGALSLLNLCIYLLRRQLDAQAQAFERNGGFTERLYRRRQIRRQQGSA